MHSRCPHNCGRGHFHVVDTTFKKTEIHESLNNKIPVHASRKAKNAYSLSRKKYRGPSSYTRGIFLIGINTHKKYIAIKILLIEIITVVRK